MMIIAKRTVPPIFVGGMILSTFVLIWSLMILGLAPRAHASIAYGSIHSFDTVNDTGVPCHGFEIELDDIHSKDITYTYDWNHYGVPRITEDNTNPLHPRVFVRYESPKKSNGAWAAFSAVPAGTISPTDGRQFTNPSVNFGGEHFGVGFYGTPTAIKYNWLKDDGAGRLVYAGAVNISAPVFTYSPPTTALPAQVLAEIAPAPPREPPAHEFGPAMWVKETRTSSHNNRKVALRDLVSEDPGDPNGRNWKNGEPAEVEAEWEILQTDFKKGDGGAKGKLAGAPEDLQHGDEVITRRYDFFKYVGPTDPETGEALAVKVGPDGVHGMGDFASVVIVGDYIGAQMAGFDAAGKIGLIDHLQDGEVNVPYVERTIVIGGTSHIMTIKTGSLPEGMTFDAVTGILSGTPTVSGAFTFTIHSMDSSGGDVTTTYKLKIVDNAAVPVQITVTTIAAPMQGGSVSGGGTYHNGALATVFATANPGFAFANWTESGAVVSASPNYEFVAELNRELTANFVHAYSVTTSANPLLGGTTSGGGMFNEGNSVTLFASAHVGYNFVNWTENGMVVSSSASYTFTASANRSLVASFANLMDVTNQMALDRNGFRYNRATGRFAQTITVINNGGVIAGPGSR